MHWIFRPSIRRKIVGIAVGLIILMVLTSVLSVFMESTLGHLLDELLTKYIPAYGHLARADVRSLERALALRQMVIAKMQTPPDEQAYAARLRIYQDLDAAVAQEAQEPASSLTQSSRTSRRLRTTLRSAASMAASRTPSGTTATV
jgi:hypothetical protein